MGTTTTNRGYRKPQYKVDPPDGVAQIGALADDIDNDLGPDHAWATLTGLVTGAGWSQGSQPAKAKLLRGVVYLKGGLLNSSFNATSPVTAASLPSGIPAPPEDWRLPMAENSSVRSAYCLILTDGSIQFATNGQTSGSTFWLSGLSYPVG